jgi:uncharacterized membrane protein
MALIGLGLDAVGVLIVGAGGVWAILHAAIRWHQPFTARYRLLRENLGRAILLGLEFLIAGDIIRSVVVAPTIRQPRSVRIGNTTRDAWSSVALLLPNYRMKPTGCGQ